MAERDKLGRFVNGSLAIKHNDNCICLRCTKISPNKGKKLNYKTNGFFKKGRVPWNKGKKMSQEQKNKLSKSHKGQIAWNYIDGRSNIPIKRNNKKVKQIWCDNNGMNRVPQGFVIHHLDCNPQNNNITNLLLLPDRFHRQLHNQMFKIMVGKI